MKKSKKSLGSDFAKIDVHVIQPHEYEELPELTDEWFKSADHFVGNKLIQRGRPRKIAPKQVTNIRLDAEVLEAFRATGRGWQSRMNDILKSWVRDHRL